MNKALIMSYEPTLMATVGEAKFYEHPIHGDEVPLIMLYNGDMFQSEFWDIPALEELYELM